MINNSEFLTSIIQEYQKNYSAWMENAGRHKILTAEFKNFCKAKGIRCTNISKSKFDASLRYSANGIIKLKVENCRFRFVSIEIKESQRFDYTFTPKTWRDKPYYIESNNTITFYFIDGTEQKRNIDEYFTRRTIAKFVNDFGMERKHLND